MRVNVDNAGLGGPGPCERRISPLLITFAQNPGKTRRVREVLSGCERAGQDLEGGGRAVTEGLDYFRIPCTTVLSVSELLVKRPLFLPGGGNIPEVGEPAFLLAGPKSLQLRD